jgi:phosphatidylglycerophosphatase A
MGIRWKHFLIKFFATGAGTGYAPIVPGTFGTLMGIVVFMVFMDLPRWVFLITVLGLTAIAIWVSELAEPLFHTKDPSYVVIDEVIGILMAMIFLPFHVKYVLIAFVVFRVMDIIKPYPAHKWQDLHGGLGIVIDDVVAGIYSGLLILFCISIFKI